MNDCFNILQKLPESVLSISSGKFGRISLLLFLVCLVGRAKVGGNVVVVASRHIGGVRGL